MRYKRTYYQEHTFIVKVVVNKSFVLFNLVGLWPVVFSFFAFWARAVGVGSRTGENEFFLAFLSPCRGYEFTVGSGRVFCF